LSVPASPTPTVGRRGVSRGIAIYFAVVLSGFALQCDDFPLTWAPMYTAHHSSDSYTVTTLDRATVRDHGFGVTRRDGSRGELTAADLNTPFRNFWPLFAERAFGEGPPKHRRAVTDSGAYNTVEVDWHARLFETVNRTLGLTPDDPRFIVELRAARRRLEIADVHTGPRIVAETLDSVILSWTPSGVRAERRMLPVDRSGAPQQ